MKYSKLNTITLGGGKKLIMLHGFTQTGESLLGIAQILSEHFTVILLDLPGHGFSPVIAKDELLLFISNQKPSFLLGYSMGARIAFDYALRFQEETLKLCLISFNPGINDNFERKRRLNLDMELASKLSKFSGVQYEQFLYDWIKSPIFKGLKESQAKIELRLNSDPAQIAASLRKYSLARYYFSDADIKRIKAKSLLIAGQEDEKYAKLAISLINKLPNSCVFLKSNASHAPHLQFPEEIACKVISFLKQST